MGMFSCYYLALVGTFPTREECEKFGGCKKCRFYLEEPSPESIVYTGQAKTSTIVTSCDDMRVKKEERGVVVTSEDLKLVYLGELPKETEEQPESPEESDDGTVHCKDCIYYQGEDELPYITSFMECARPNPEDPEWHLKYHFKSDNDSCPHGVRREDG